VSNKLVYRSSGIELFDKWSNAMFLFLGTVVVLWYFNFAFKAILGYGLLLVFLIMTFYVFINLSKVSRHGSRILLSDNFKKQQIQNIKSIDSWWCYESPGESPEFNGWFGRFSGKSKMKGHSNKINIYVRIKSKYDFVLIREQIHLSSKFPNNHTYNANEIVNTNKVFRVWDVDECVEKLKLMEMV